MIKFWCEQIKFLLECSISMIAVASWSMVLASCVAGCGGQNIPDHTEKPQCALLIAQAANQPPSNVYPGGALSVGANSPINQIPLCN